MLPVIHGSDLHRNIFTTIFLILSVVINHTTEACSIVFVHIGETLPIDHDLNWLNKLNIRTVCLELLRKSPEHVDFLQKTPHKEPFCAIQVNVFCI